MGDKIFKNSVRVFSSGGIDFIGEGDSGALIGLDTPGTDVIRCLLDRKKSEHEAEEKILIDALKRNGFFFDANEKRMIKTAYLHVTDRCNLRCRGCYSFVKNRNGKRDLSLNEIKSVVLKLKKSGCKGVVISGGEPYLREDIIEILDYINKQNIFIDIITNGTMEYERYLASLKYINKLNISIDGFDDESCFIRGKEIDSRVIENIEKLKGKVSLNMIVTLHQKNVHLIDEYENFSKNIGVPFNLSMLTVDNSNEELREFILREEDYVEAIGCADESGIGVAEELSEGDMLSCSIRCEAGRGLVSIAADGTIYPCHMLHLEEFKIGNVLKGDLLEQVYSDKNIFLNIDVDCIEECDGCEIKYLCGNRCRAKGYYESGKINGRNKLCSAMKQNISSKLEKLRNRYGID